MKNFYKNYFEDIPGISTKADTFSGKSSTTLPSLVQSGDRWAAKSFAVELYALASIFSILKEMLNLFSSVR